MCGIVGVLGSPCASKEVFLGLTVLQHRGQDGAGITSYCQSGFHTVKKPGLVEQIFNREHIEFLSGNAALGHTRYSTTGIGNELDLQPMLLSYPFGLGMAHNGNVVNYLSLKSKLKTQFCRQLLSQSDTEVILNLFAAYLQKEIPQDQSLNFDHLCQALLHLFQTLEGSYSVLTLIADQGLIAFRDPHGIRPLVLGKKKNAYMVASESAPLCFNDYSILGDIAPGEVVWIQPGGNVLRKVLVSKSHRPCMFEWIYFASPESVLDQVGVYRARILFGNYLAATVQSKLKALGIEMDMIVPVPETARIAAIALSEALGVPYRELLIKNRYIKRTFILDSHEKRQKAVELKLSPVRSEMKGKNVLLVDDSIVRGTTSRKIIELVRRAGARKVVFVSTCPPISSACFYGIDFPSRKELFAGQDQSLSDLEQSLGADGLVYQRLEDLRKALQDAGGPWDPCCACLDGRYPTDVSESLAFEKKRTLDRKKKRNDL